MSRADFDVLPIAGAYQIHKAGGMNGSRKGRLRHDSFSAAEAEALRLADMHPGTAFIITREVARVQPHQLRRTR